jgi:hypothetical protein
VVVEMSSRVARRVDWKNRSEFELRRAAIRGGPSREVAWKEIIRRYEPKVSHAISSTLVRLGRQAQAHLVDELVEATWVRIAAKGCRLLRVWNPTQGDLGKFLASIGRWQTRTSSQILARRKEVQLDEVEIRRLADRQDSRLSPEEVAQFKEAEITVRAWEAGLGLLERAVWEMRKEGASSRAIGLFLRRDHKTVATILSRLQRRFRDLLEI